MTKYDKRIAKNICKKFVPLGFFYYYKSTLLQEIEFLLYWMKITGFVIVAPRNAMSNRSQAISGIKFKSLFQTVTGKDKLIKLNMIHT